MATERQATASDGHAHSRGLGAGASRMSARHTHGKDVGSGCTKHRVRVRGDQEVRGLKAHLRLNQPSSFWSTSKGPLWHPWVRSSHHSLRLVAPKLAFPSKSSGMFLKNRSSWTPLPETTVQQLWVEVSESGFFQISCRGSAMLGRLSCRGQSQQALRRALHATAGVYRRCAAEAQSRCPSLSKQALQHEESSREELESTWHKGHDISNLAYQNPMGGVVGFIIVVVVYCYYCFNMEPQAPAQTA